MTRLQENEASAEARQLAASSSLDQAIRSQTLEQLRSAVARAEHRDIEKTLEIIQLLAQARLMISQLPVHVPQPPEPQPPPPKPTHNLVSIQVFSQRPWQIVSS